MRVTSSREIEVVVFEKGKSACLSRPYQMWNIKYSQMNNLFVPHDITSSVVVAIFQQNDMEVTFTTRFLPISRAYGNVPTDPLRGALCFSIVSYYSGN